MIKKTQEKLNITISLSYDGEHFPLRSLPSFSVCVLYRTLELMKICVSHVGIILSQSWEISTMHPFLQHDLSPQGPISTLSCIITNLNAGSRYSKTRQHAVSQRGIPSQPNETCMFTNHPDRPLWYTQIRKMKKLCEVIGTRRTNPSQMLYATL